MWGYLKHYTRAVPEVNYLEGELTVTLPNRAPIRLYGGALAYERMRGIYLDGAVLDEYPLLHPTAFTSVVSPCLADYRGFAIVSGTAAGEDHFHALKLRAEQDPNWAVFTIPITDTGTSALVPEEVAEMRHDMADDEFAREMLCSFEAPVEGAYYQEAMNSLQIQNRVTKVPSISTPACSPAGTSASRTCSAFGWVRLAGREIHWIDYIEDRGKPLSHYANLLALKAKTNGFAYRAHLLPHDVEARELSTGKSRRHELTDLLDAPVITVPRHDPADGIAAARGVLGVSWFDEQSCRRGLARLRAYRRGKTGTPVHDDASHGADAFRTAAVGIPLISGGFSARHGAQGRLRRKIRGLV